LIFCSPNGIYIHRTQTARVTLLRKSGDLSRLSRLPRSFICQKWPDRITVSKKPGGRGLVSIVQLIRKLLRLQIGNGGTSFNDYVKTRCCKRSGLCWLQKCSCFV